MLSLSSFEAQDVSDTVEDEWQLKYISSVEVREEDEKEDELLRSVSMKDEWPES